VNVTLGAFAESGAQAAQLVSAYDVACSKQQTAGLGQLIQITSRCSKSADGRLSLAGVAALPAAVVTYKPILAKTLAPLPLARELQDSLRGGSTKPFEVCCPWLKAHGIELCCLWMKAHAREPAIVEGHRKLLMQHLMAQECILVVNLDSVALQRVLKSSSSPYCCRQGSCLWTRAGAWCCWQLRIPQPMQCP